MKVTIDKTVFKRYPKFQIALLVVTNIDNKTKLKESKHLLAEAEKMVTLTFNKDTLKNHHLIKPWTVAQEEFGKAAKHYHTSVEGLLQKVLRKKRVSAKDVLTNLIRYLSLKYVVPYGVDDATEIKGDLKFTMAKGSEKAGVLHRLKRGSLYYKDSKSVLGTKLDSWKNRRTRLLPVSVDAVVHFEFMPPLTKKKMTEIMREAKTLITSFSKGQVKVYFLGKSKPTVTV